MTPELAEKLVRVAAAARAAGHGQKEAIYRQACADLGLSRAALFRCLKQTAERASRKRRADCGASALPYAEARVISTYLLLGYRRNDKKMMSLETAVESLRANGRVLAGRVDATSGEFRPLSVSAIARALYTYCLHPEQLRKPAPHVTLRSLFPNHVWQVDASVCTLYYLPVEGAIIETDVAIHYKNKPANLKAIERQRVIRYVVVDHASGTVRWRYYPHSESGEHTARFLAWAMAPKADRADPFHGAPYILQADPGATASALVKRFCQRLGIELLVTQPGAPRAKGAVEKGQDIVEANFEQGLRFVRHKVTSLDALNALADSMQLGFNSHKLHSRTGKARFDVWMQIRPDQLRVTPPEAELVKLIHETPVSRTVDDGLQIRLDNAAYRCKDVPGIYVGRKLDVFRSPLAEAVYAVVHDADGHERHVELPKVEVDQYGFDTAGPVIGREFKSHADTVLEQGRKRALLDATGADTQDEAEQREKRASFVPFGGSIDPFKSWTDAPAPDRLPRRGTTLGVNTPRVEAPPLSLTQFLMRLKRQHGRTLSPAEQAWLAARHPDGITEEQAAALIAELTTNSGRAAGGRG